MYAHCRDYYEARTRDMWIACGPCPELDALRELWIVYTELCGKR